MKRVGATMAVSTMVKGLSKGLQRQGLEADSADMLASFILPASLSQLGTDVPAEMLLAAKVQSSTTLAEGITGEGGYVPPAPKKGAQFQTMRRVNLRNPEEWDILAGCEFTWHTIMDKGGINPEDIRAIHTYWDGHQYYFARGVTKSGTYFILEGEDCDLCGGFSCSDSRVTLKKYSKNPKNLFHPQYASSYQKVRILKGFEHPELLAEQAACDAARDLKRNSFFSALTGFLSKLDKGTAK